MRGMTLVALLSTSTITFAIKNYMQLIIHLAVLETINNSVRGWNYSLWKWQFPPHSSLKLRFSFNVCQDILQEPMILPVFLSRGT